MYRVDIQSVLGALAIMMSLSACGGDGQPSNEIEEDAGEPILRATPLKVVWDPELSATAEQVGAPAYGNHELTKEQQRVYTMMPGAHVAKFKRYVKNVIGLEIPDSSGSYVGLTRRYKIWKSGNPNNSPIPAPDDFEYGKLAFMIPPEDAAEFVEHLKNCGERIEERSLLNYYRWLEGNRERTASKMTFEVTGAVGLAEFNLRHGESLQRVEIGINLENGIVYYRSLVDSDDD